MTNLENNECEEIQDTLTDEEEKKIVNIIISTFQSKKKSKPFSICSIFGCGTEETVIIDNPMKTNMGINIVPDASGNVVLQKPIIYTNFVNESFIKFLNSNTSIIINNISGKKAYVLLSPAPIKTINHVGISAGVSGLEGSIDVSMEDKGDYKIQKISIANNTSSTCELDNVNFYCTLFLNVDGKWKKSWENRRFNTKNQYLNILEKHVISALEKDNIPDF